MCQFRLVTNHLPRQPILKSSTSMTCPMKNFFQRKESCFLVEKPRIILSETQTFNLFIARECHEGFIEQEDIIALEPDIWVSKIRNNLADIDLDPDMPGRGEEYGMTRLRPNEESDLIVVGYVLMKAVLDKKSGNRRTIALAYIAILICHEMANAFGFRFIRSGSFRDDGEAFKTPSGLTCTEAGISWERNTLVAVSHQFGPQACLYSYPAGVICTCQ